MALDVQTLRDQFPVTEEWAYLNHAAIGPFSRQTTAAIHDVTAAFASPASMDNVAREDAPLIARQNVAALAGGDPERVAFVGSLADAMSLCAAGISWQSGDNVVIPKDEFPSVVYAFLNLGRLGVEVRFVDKNEQGFTDLNRIEAAIDDRTRALVLSHVEFMTGFRNDLRAIGKLCREKDILSIVDVTQSMGPNYINADENGIDVVAAHGYKWLMSSFGLGVMHFSERAIERIHPVYAGRLGVTSGFEDLDYALNWGPGAQRYQTGGLNWIILAALNASADLIRSVGTAAIQHHTLTLTERLLDDVAQIGYHITSDRTAAHRSAIVSFSTGSLENDGRIVEDLENRQISVSLRGKGIRVSPYLYNNDEDIARLVDALPHR